MAAPLLLRVPATLHGFHDAAVALRGLLDRRTLDADLRYNVELTFEEVATNIIRHGSPKADIVVTLHLDGDEAVLTFEDDGVPFDPREQQPHPVPASLDETRIGGFGLVLVRSVSSRIEYARTDQDRNRLTLALRPAPDPGSGA
jgi:anti-sigma regulatory factor (Ser/Thr protein kinase)